MIFKKPFYLFLVAVLVAAATVSPAQKKNGRRARPAAKPSAAPAARTVSPDAAPAAAPATKKNERPVAETNASGGTDASPAASAGRVEPAYVYEFSRPGFLVPYVRIEHDESGRGIITFEKKGMDGRESDPVVISPATLGRLKTAFAELNFLDSTEDYQTKRGYPTLGSISITMNSGGRRRTVSFNRTENKSAGLIADEYRKLGYQYVWQFDIAVARGNQPLNAPSLMAELDSYLRRNEISDPRQLLPLLTQLSNDERIPLIARNHAAKLITQISKEKK